MLKKQKIIIIMILGLHQTTRPIIAIPGIVVVELIVVDGEMKVNLFNLVIYLEHR